MCLTILFSATLMTMLASVLADEPKPFLKLVGTLTTESDKEPGFYPKYFNTHPVKLTAGRAYRIELVSKEFSVDLSVQDLSKKNGQEVGANPKPGNQSLTRLIYVCEIDGEHVVTVKGGHPGQGWVGGVSPHAGTQPLDAHHHHHRNAQPIRPRVAPGCQRHHGKAARPAPLIQSHEANN